MCVCVCVTLTTQHSLIPATMLKSEISGERIIAFVFFHKASSLYSNSFFKVTISK